MQFCQICRNKIAFIFLMCKFIKIIRNLMCNQNQKLPLQNDLKSISELTTISNHEFISLDFKSYPILVTWQCSEILPSGMATRRFYSHICKLVTIAYSVSWAWSWFRFLGSQPAGDLVINPVLGYRYIFHQARGYLPNQRDHPLAGTK